VDPSSHTLSKVLYTLPPVKFKKFAKIPPTPLLEQDHFETKMEFSRAPIFLAGKYLKLSRQMSQSPWIIQGQRLTESSVEEFIGEALQQLIKGDGKNNIKK
jgi:tRNA pseudouridine synthase 10